MVVDGVAEPDQRVRWPSTAARALSFRAASSVTASTTPLLDHGDDVARADRLAGRHPDLFDRPAFSALTLFSIFMASSTQTVWPTSTASPSATSTLTMVPCMGTATVPDPAPEAAAFGRFGPAPGRHRPRRRRR